jgi:diguanylate cyclase (GGDEF)-like protein
VARRLQSAAPADALVARLGGDEFVILAHSTDTTAAKALAERCIDLFRPAYRVGDKDQLITTSVGVVSTPVGRAAAYDQALHHADLALYEAKSAGKNQYAMR